MHYKHKWGVGSGLWEKFLWEKFLELMCTLANVKVIDNLEAGQGTIRLYKHLQAIFLQLDRYNNQAI